MFVYVRVQRHVIRGLSVVARVGLRPVGFKSIRSTSRYQLPVEFSAYARQSTLNHFFVPRVSIGS